MALPAGFEAFNHALYQSTRVRLEPGLWKAREGVEERLTKLPAGIGTAFERLGPQLKKSQLVCTGPAASLPAGGPRPPCRPPPRR